MIEVAIIAVCLILNAMFAAVEMAFVAIPRSELRNLAKAGNKRSAQLIRMRDNPERTLSIIQVGITVVSAIAAAVGGAGATKSIEPYLINELGITGGGSEILAIFLAVIPITYLSVVVGELVPKTLALKNPMRIALSGAKWLVLADRILNPIVSLLEWSTKTVMRFFKKKTDSGSVSPGISAIEIDKLSPVHQKYMLNMADIEKRRIADICVDWAQVASVEKNFSMDQVIDVILRSGHTRLPVVDADRIVGILHAKEFAVLKETGATAWQPIIRQAICVRDTDSALGALRRLQKERNHMAIVISATSSRLGIVTLEDILEQVVGDIFDEDDDGFVQSLLATSRWNRRNRKK